VPEVETGALDTGAILQGNYPNPFNPATRIAYSLTEPGVVSLQVYDVSGRKVRNLIDQHQEAGAHAVDFSAGSREELASGVYFYRLAVGGEVVQTRRMMLVK